MLHYIEMGFSETAAASAAERFGDNIHRGCHWLMTRETVGRVPKRLCLGKKDGTTTYYGSEVEFDGVVWKVEMFDQKHALIRVRHQNMVRWEHISDARIEWVAIHHNQVRNSVPRACWKRKIGSITMSLSSIASEVEVGPENAVSLLLTHGRPSGGDEGLWHALVNLTQVFKHKPCRPSPRSCSSKGIHDFLVELMTYFIVFCDVYAVNDETFATKLYDSDVNDVLELFPSAIRSEMRVHLTHWYNPQLFLEEQQKKWTHDCLPLFEFVCSDIDRDDINIDVLFHDMTFVQLPLVEGAAERLHHHCQCLFYNLFNYAEKYTQGCLVLDRQQLQLTLKNCRKKHTSTLTPNKRFVTELFPYQKKVVSWLVSRETTKSQSTSAWGWQRHQLDDGFAFHTSVFGHISHTSPSSNVRGGILAQDVGMGKTVEMLALIGESRRHSDSGPTLVIMPTTMLAVWMAEARKHLPSMKTVKYHGTRRSLDNIQEIDIVCTTYRIVANESHLPTLGTVRWSRIILDESHELKNMNSITTQAVCQLQAPFKWCVSATPWVKDSQNIFAYMAFFNVSPFNVQLSGGRFQPRLFMNSWTVHDICQFLSSVTWWQQKCHVRLNLPPVTRQTIECSNNQSIGYAHLVRAIRARVNNHQETSSGRRSHRLYDTWLLKIAAIDISLVPLAAFGTLCQQGRHHSESNTVESFVATLGTSLYDSSVRTLVNSWSEGNITCSICMDVMERPTLTPCHHMFCFECIQSSYQHDMDHKCPLCRTAAGTKCLKELTMDNVEETVGDMWYTSDISGKLVQLPMVTKGEIFNDCLVPSSKFKTVLDMIDKNGKTVIFTQYHVACTALCLELSTRQIPFVSIQGRMSPHQRQASIESFQQDINIKVFVMTLKTAAVGITLTAASSVVFLEPTMSADMQKQAIGRVWRIGQTQPISVTTLVTRDTIDTCTMEQLLTINI